MSQAAVNLIRSRFGSQFEDMHGPSDSVPVLCIYDNEPTKEPDVDKQFARLRVDWTRSYLAGLGNPRFFRDEGLVSVQLFTPQGAGDKILLDLAEEIRTIFQSLTVSDGGTVVVFQQPRYVRVGAEGPFYQMNVIVKFWADFTAA